MPTCHLANIRLHYETAGQGQPLLFIHGLGSSTRDWAAQMNFFAGRYRVITFDLRGHGQSDKPPGPYSMPLFAADTAALLNQLNVGPAHVVGLSLGGSIAFQLAVDAPEVVHSLTIVNSGPEVPLRTLKERLQVAAGFLIRQLVVRVAGMRKMGQILAGKLLPDPEQAPTRQAMIERWAQNDKRAYLAAMNAFRGWSVLDRLESITCPVLVLHAEYDYTPLQFKAAYAALLPRSNLVVIPESRHMSPVDKPVKFNQVLQNFLEQFSHS